MAIVRPSSDIVTGGWSSTGSTLYEAIDETTASDADYISSSTSGQIARIALGSTTDPGVDTGHVLRYRAASDGDRGLIVRVKQGSTVIAERTPNLAPAIWTSKQPWRSQPQTSVEVDWSNPLARTITHCIPFNGDLRDIVTGNRVTLTNGSVGVDARGKSLRGNGTQSCGSIPLNLSAYNTATISFWLYWDAFANDDDFAMEFTASANTNNGAFSIDPNASVGRFQVAVNDGGSITVVGASFTRPSSSSWHHYMIGIASTGSGTPIAFQGVRFAYVDGISQSLTVDAGVGGGTLSGNFANSTLYLFSRAGSSLYGAGRLQNLIFRGGYLGTATDALKEYNNPWQIFRPLRKVHYSLPGPTDYTIDLTSGEAATITDYSSLALEVEST